MISAAFALAVVLSLVGNFSGEESAAQTVLFALSSVALATGAACACVSLARGPHGRAAAGFGILVVAEGLLWTGRATDPSSHTALAAGELFYAPARAHCFDAIGAGLEPHGGRRGGSVLRTARAAVRGWRAHPDSLSDAGFVLLAVTVAGWVVRERRRTARA